MDLFQNPFNILNASPFDNRAKLKDLADEHSLLLIAAESEQAYNVLIHPIKRLSAEIAWLPGVSLEPVSVILELLKSSPFSLFDPSLNSEALDLSKFTPVARANIIAAGLSKLGSCEPSAVISMIIKLAQTFEEVIKPEGLKVIMRILNEERAISGFPKVSDITAIGTEIQERRRYYQKVIRLALDNLPTEELVKVVTDTVKLATDNGKQHELILIDDMIDFYELEAQSFFEKEEGNIKTLIEKIRAMIREKQSNSVVSIVINQLTKVLNNWGLVAKPININAEARGLSHNASHRIVKYVRDLKVYICNNNSPPVFAKKLTNMLQEIFGVIKGISEILTEDIEALNKILEQLNKVIFKATIGVLREKLTLTREELEWQDRKWSLDSITYIRWGGRRNSVNGIPTGTAYGIFWGNDTESESISPGEVVYSKLIDCLWSTIGIRILIEYLEGLKSGKSYRFGSALVSDFGIEMERRKPSSIERVFCSWEEMVLFNGNGTFCVGSKNDKSVSASLSYLQDDNIHILEAMLRKLWKQGGYKRKLSSLLTTQN